MFKIGDWVTPKQGLLPIDAERNRKNGRGRQITSVEPLQVKDRSYSSGEERLTFKGQDGQYLAAFFDPMTAVAKLIAFALERSGSLNFSFFDHVHTRI